ILIIAQNDFGSALVYFSFILVLFRAGLPGKYILYMIFLMILFFISLIIDHIYIIPGLLVLFFLRYSYIIKQVKEPLISFSILTGFTLICIGINEVLNLNISIIGIILLCIGLGMIGIIIYNRRGNIGSIFRNIALLIVALFITFSVNYVYNNILEPYHRQRIDLMLGIKNDPLGAGYNINQSKIAIGSGGFSGKGYLKGTQTKYEFVPEQATDFIFCTIGEEWGFLGAGAVILLFAGLLSRLVFIAERQRSEFSRIYGYCVVSILFFHFAINMAMTIGLFPVIGIPLPFISYGGSSLLAFTLLFFIFIRMDSERHLVIV
ncbi:rod shape-determining protein RodA, partial [Bacteroidota bacterium]